MVGTITKIAFVVGEAKMFTPFIEREVEVDILKSKLNRGASSFAMIERCVPTCSRTQGSTGDKYSHPTYKTDTCQQCHINVQNRYLC